MRIYEYKVVKKSFFTGSLPSAVLKTIEELEQQVSQLLTAGWRCQGGTVIDHQIGVVYQTMTRSLKVA